jgi:hypothetical protein
MHAKANAAGCHRIPRARYRVTIWPVYEAGLRRRDNLTLWLDQDDFVGWAAPGGNTPGGQSRYSDSAIELVLFLRLLFDLALRPGSSLDDRARVNHGARGNSGCAHVETKGRTLGNALRLPPGKCPAAAGQGRVIRHMQLQPEQHQHTPGESLRLAQGEMELQMQG